VEKRGFKNYKTGEWEYGMSPTELKNYPVQGFATADIVPLMLGKIANWLWNSPARDNLLMVLTVHDSLMFDSDNSPAAIAAIGAVTEMLLNTAAEIKSTFGVNVNVPFNVEVKMGPSWYSKDMEVVHA
jgi:DNA polymerase I-like protein with 3'-5' exonuclease and polymerase domains